MEKEKLDLTEKIDDMIKQEAALTTKVILHLFFRGMKNLKFHRFGFKTHLTGSC